MPYVDNQGVHVYYEVEGVGKPLVLSHGIYGQLNDWRQLYDYASVLRRNNKLILIDARGHGQSDKPHNPKEYATQLMVSDVIAVLDDLGISKTHFLGFSMGGGTGFGIMKYAPKRVYSLIIGGLCPRALTEEDHKWFDGEIQRLKKGHDAVIKAWQRASLKVTEKEVTPYIKASLAANDLEAITARLLYVKYYLQDLSDILPTITVPCLLYAGERDGDYLNIKKCAESIPNATFISLPGVDHYGTIQRGDLILPHITKFLAQMA